MTISPSRTKRAFRAAHRAERRLELREVAVERLQVAGLDVELVAVAEDDGAEPVPLRLVDPARAVGEAGVGFASIGSMGGSKGNAMRGSYGDRCAAYFVE